MVLFIMLYKVVQDQEKCLLNEGVPKKRFHFFFYNNNCILSA